MRRFRFSIRALLLLALVSAIGIVVYQRQSRIREVVRRFESVGGTVEYEESRLDWFHENTGNFFAAPVAVDLSRSRVQMGDLEGIEGLTQLQRLYLHRTAIGKEDVVSLAKCRKLKRLSLWGNRRIGNSAIDYLAELSDLEVLDLHYTSITPGTLGRLGGLPKLKTLVFSSGYHTPKEDRMTGQVMRQLSGIPTLKPFGECFLWQFDSEELLMFCRAKTDHFRSLLLRDCVLDEAACKAIDSLPVTNLDLQLCGIDDEHLALFTSAPECRFDITNNKTDAKTARVSLAGITSWLPRGLKEVSIYDDYVEFDYGHRWSWEVRLSHYNDRLNAEVLSRWVDLGLRKLRLMDENYLRSDLEVVLAVNPSIELSLHNHLFIWPQIEKLTNLQGLKVFSNHATPLRFSRESNLRSVYLLGQPTLNESSFRQLAKLKNLRWLQIQNEQRLTVADLKPLRDLRHLTHIITGRATDEAAALIESMETTNRQRHLSWDEIRASQKPGS